ncbi:phosphotransferase [Pyxidicoccus fallax]|uniref:Phosphotransferase n=1 Tax=Pyxidicoccus fallax TaxID=394095 RepID=A0A848LTU4_9BACT|nr:phosphotransferase [Pyxidicoccus fallax]
MGYPYLVLEYVHGEGLYRWVWLRNPTARQVAGLLLQVAEALAAAHARGVLHRDFKGGNVLVRGDGRLVVLDWGAGIYPQAAPLTRTGRLPPGTPAYFSPRVMAWRTRALGGGGGRYPYTVADEAYAVGVTFYRLLADEYPPLQLGWGEADAEQEAGAVAPEPLSRLNPRVPETLAAVVMRLVAFRPEARPARTEVLAAEVRALLRAADAAWDVPLFEWYAGPGPHSRTTTGQEEWGPVAPGDEADLLRDRQQRIDARANRAAERWLRRRHPQSLAPREEEDAAAPQPVGKAQTLLDVLPLVAPAPVAAGGEAAPEETRPVPAPGPRPTMGQVATGALEPVAAEALPSRRHASRPRAWLALLVVAGLAGGVLVARRGPVPTPHGAPVTSDREVAPPPEAPDADAPAGASRAVPPPPSLQEQPMPSSSPLSVRKPGLVSSLKRGVAACGAATAMACSGAPVRPTAGSACPERAFADMRELGLNEGRQVNIYVHKDKPGYLGDPLFVREGEIVSRVFDSTSLPDDTLIYGWLSIGKERVFGYYTMLELPNGRRYSVCLVLNNERGQPKNAASTPDAPAVSRVSVFKVVDSF